MTLQELKTEISKYQYLEDTDIIDIALASIISTRLKLGDPIWLVVIGASSGGKSQILRPLALTDTKFLHRIDDLTENTFLSGMNSKDGEMSLLKRIGPSGIIVISDLTVIFSKASESSSAILAQFRMIYDGEMTKAVGNSGKPVHWKGSLGVIAGSTPSIYRHFETASDMGERFVYYRMKEYDARKATTVALTRTIYGKELDDVLASLYGEYIKATVTSAITEFTLPDIVHERIIEVASLAERIRTPVVMDWRGDKMTHIPIPAMPMRVALQLIAIAKGLRVMRGVDLSERDLSIIDWCAYSLANEEKRTCLATIASVNFDFGMTTSTIADIIGLDTSIIRSVLQNLSGVGVLTRSANDSGELLWSFAKIGDYDAIRRMANITTPTTIMNRKTSEEEFTEKETETDNIFDNI